MQSTPLRKRNDQLLFQVGISNSSFSHSDRYTVATAEQSFSRLKIISIKVEEAKKLEIDKMINIFAVSLQRKSQKGQIK